MRNVPKDRLINLMSEHFNTISEEYWSAGWSIGLEYDLWSDALFLRNNIGVMHDSKINDSEKLHRTGPDYVNAVLTLIVLSEHLEGWLSWPKNSKAHCEQFIPMEEWLKMYGEGKKSHHM